MKTYPAFFKPLEALLFVFLLSLMVISCQNKNGTTDQTTDKDSTEQTQEKTFGDQTSQVEHLDWTRTASIYEVNIRQYSPEGTFKAFENDLPRLKKLGVDILWLMPIHPIGEKNRKGELGSYYSVKDYKAVNPEFGTMDDFKALVEKVHELGMYLIIDWVPNHTAWDNAWIEKHPEWYKKDSVGNPVSPFDWTDVAQLDYENHEMRSAMIESMKFWLQEANIDGFRCDVAHMVPVDFWDVARTELEKVKPVFMLAEAEIPELHLKAFDMGYAWEFHHIMNEIAKGNKTAADIMPYLEKERKRFPKDTYLMHFTSNHDENSWNGTVYERLGDGIKAFAVLASTMPGMPLIYNGQEAGMDKRLEFFTKDTIDWKEHELFDFYQTLFALKEQNKALRNGAQGGELVYVPTSDEQAIFAFVREKEGDKIFVLLNLSDQSKQITLQGSDFTGQYTEVFTNEKKTFEKNAGLDMKPYDFYVYTN